MRSSLKNHVTLVKCYNQEELCSPILAALSANDTNEILTKFDDPDIVTTLNYLTSTKHHKPISINTVATTPREKEDSVPPIDSFISFFIVLFSSFVLYFYRNLSLSNQQMEQVLSNCQL